MCHQRCICETYCYCFRCLNLWSEDDALPMTLARVLEESGMNAPERLGIRTQIVRNFASVQEVAKTPRSAFIEAALKRYTEKSEAPPRGLQPTVTKLWEACADVSTLLECLFRHRARPESIVQRGWIHVTDMANDFDNEDDAAAHDSNLRSAWKEADMLAARASSAWRTAPTTRRTYPVLEIVTPRPFKRVRMSKRIADKLKHVEVSVGGTVQSEQSSGDERRRQFALTTWKHLLTLDSTITDEFNKINGTTTEDGELFAKHRCQEFACYDWHWLRACLGTITDFADFLRIRSRAIDKELQASQARPNQVDVDEYVRLRATGNSSWLMTTSRRGGASAGRTAAVHMRWWARHAGLRIPDVKDPPPSVTAPGPVAVRAKSGQAIPFSISIVVHMERWAVSSVKSAAIFAGGCCTMAHGVLRFRHAQRAKRVTNQQLCMKLVVFKGKKKVGYDQPAFEVHVPKSGVTGNGWVDTFFASMDDYDESRGERADFLIPGFARKNEEHTMMGTAMTYPQYRQTLVEFLGQPPLNLDPEIAWKLSAHSARRYAPTVAVSLELDDTSASALGNWSCGKKNPTTNMPLRYTGGRECLELGTKIEVVEAAKWVYGIIGDGVKLNWAKFREVLTRPDRPDFKQIAAKFMTSVDDPTGSKNDPGIYMLPLKDVATVDKVDDTKGEKGSVSTPSSDDDMEALGDSSDTAESRHHADTDPDEEDKPRTVGAVASGQSDDSKWPEVAVIVEAESKQAQRPESGAASSSAGEWAAIAQVMGETDQRSGTGDTTTRAPSAATPPADVEQAFDEVEELRRGRNLIVHPLRGTLHIQRTVLQTDTDKTTKTACGLFLHKMEHLTITTVDAVTESWCLCGRPGCFREAKATMLQSRVGGTNVMNAPAQ